MLACSINEIEWWTLSHLTITKGQKKKMRHLLIFLSFFFRLNTINANWVTRCHLTFQGIVQNINVVLDTYSMSKKMCYMQMVY
jgi:hypothetical protein